MNPGSMQQEVLLCTTTHFSQRQWCALDASDKSGPVRSPLEALEKACWDGLLYEMLPKIMSRAFRERKIFLWHLQHGERFLLLELGGLPPQSDPASSINPYLFLQELNDN